MFQRADNQKFFPFNDTLTENLNSLMIRENSEDLSPV